MKLSKHKVKQIISFSFFYLAIKNFTSKTIYHISTCFNTIKTYLKDLNIPKTFNITWYTVYLTNIVDAES